MYSMVHHSSHQSSLPPPVVRIGLDSSSYSVEEEAGSVRVCLELHGLLAREITVSLSTVDGTATGE